MTHNPESQLPISALGEILTEALASLPARQRRKLTRVLAAIRAAPMGSVLRVHLVQDARRLLAISDTRKDSP